MEKRDRILAKVRALLAKAESTEFRDEAETYTAKAQELIAAHAIDIALLEAKEGRGQVVTRVIDVPKPYPKEKFILLSGIARANNSRAILGVEDSVFARMVDDRSYLDYDGEIATLVGYESDLEAIELLFTSLLVQAVNEMLAHGSQVTPWGENRTKSFRRSFLNQFGRTVGTRLAEVRDNAKAHASEQHGESLLPVLASREDAVEDELGARFPHTSPLRTSVSNWSGVVAGNEAGNRADIGTSRLHGSQPAIGA